ncbi:histidine kinase [Luteitalea sp. TBR-22]|uniref:hybrid sensor histidine kinase/response regulator n=1 Tax=Luteitalea sp. TBR-22 TaxID=2802971 RepID=UPI001AF4FC90|nr:PAS domain-containing sensor histidine kinase [Luteitalea sp. TBR-22]BCS35822.1 histidine kinase [Luteitalea sp. TBR-22]
MPDHATSTTAAPAAGNPSPERAARETASVSAWGELLQAARISAAEQDLDLRYLAVLDQPGGSRADIIGRREDEVYPPLVAATLTAIKREAIETGTSQQGRVELPSDGIVRSFEVTATPRRDETGRIIGVLSLAVELTEALRAQEQSRASQSRLAGILNSAMDAIISADASRRIVFFNPAAERMFGVESREVIGQPIDRFVPEAVRQEHAALMRNFAETASSARRISLPDLKAVRASGEELPIEASISHTGAGDDQLFTIIVRDRTEHDQLHAQLLQSQKLEGIGRLAGGVAHDFNNLLTVILGYCELLRMRQRGGTELEEINNAARRASQLTRQLLAFSRRQVLQVETLDLNGLIRGLNRMLRRIIGEDVVLDTSLADDFLWVVADVGQMEQVLLNLVVNARDAMPSGGTLRIATRVTEHASAQGGGPRQSVELTVSDTGIGMSEEVRSRIFEPFFTTKGDAGTGLGLATVYGIVTQTGGDIACSSSIGQGSTFHVWLPLAPPPREPAPSASVATHAAHGHETVLLVEDEALVRELAARALREYGYKVLEAPDVDSALRYIDHPSLAVVVSDVVMPGRSGDDLMTEVARRRPSLPVLLMTGYSEALLQRPVDAAHLLRKPFTPSDLIGKIRHLIDRTR